MVLGQVGDLVGSVPGASWRPVGRPAFWAAGQGGRRVCGSLVGLRSVVPEGSRSGASGGDRRGDRHRLSVSRARYLGKSGPVTVTDWRLSPDGQPGRRAGGDCPGGGPERPESPERGLSWGFVWRKVVRDGPERVREDGRPGCCGPLCGPFRTTFRQVFGQVRGLYGLSGLSGPPVRRAGRRGRRSAGVRRWRRGRRRSREAGTGGR